MLRRFASRVFSMSTASTCATQTAHTESERNAVVDAILAIVNRRTKDDGASSPPVVGVVTSIAQGAHVGSMVISIRITVALPSGTNPLAQFDANNDATLERLKLRLEREVPLLSTSRQVSKIDGVEELRVVVPSRECADRVAWQYARSNATTRRLGVASTAVLISAGLALVTMAWLANVDGDQREL